MKIENVNGSSRVSGNPPSPYTSWLGYWESNAGFTLEFNTLYNCPACGNAYYKKDFDGCHVQKANSIIDRSWYIVPLCSSCNQSTSVLDVGSQVKLIPVPSNL